MKGYAFTTRWERFILFFIKGTISWDGSTGLEIKDFRGKKYVTREFWRDREGKVKPL